MYSVYTTYAAKAPPEDKSLSKAVIHLRIGAAECLFVRSRFREAANKLAKIRGMKMDSGEAAAYHWAYALALRGTGEHRASLEHLHAVAEGKSKHAEFALTSLIHAYAKLGDKENSRKYYQEWEARFSPSDADRQALLSQLRDALTDNATPKTK